MAEPAGLQVAQTLIVTAPQEVEARVVDMKRWASLRKRVSNIAKLEKNLASAAWAFVGISISAVLAIVTWVPAYRTMAVDVQQQFTWVWVALCGAALIGVAGAASLFLSDRVISASRAVSVESVLEDMDALVEH